MGSRRVGGGASSEFAPSIVRSSNSASCSSRTTRWRTTSRRDSSSGFGSTVASWPSRTPTWRPRLRCCCAKTARASPAFIAPHIPSPPRRACTSTTSSRRSATTFSASRLEISLDRCARETNTCSISSEDKALPTPRDPEIRRLAEDGVLGHALKQHLDHHVEWHAVIH